MATAELRVTPLAGLPEITAGDDLATVIAAGLTAADLALQDGDILVVTSKIVSKSLGLYADPTDRESLVLAQSSSVVAERRTPDAITRVVAARSGPVMAGAGIDASNASDTQDERLLLLPRDPDGAARDLHERLAALVPTRFALVLSDTSGRAWRAGLTDFALGCSGLAALEDLRGHADTHGRDLAVTVRNLADEIASAADLVKGKLDRVPVAIVRGLDHLVQAPQDGIPARDLVRSGPGDWFALGRAEAVRDALGVPAGSDLSRQLGIESVLPEPLVDRVARAVRVALSADDEVGVDLDASGESVTLTAGDLLALGRVWARMEVALAGERLGCEGSPADLVVTLRVRERSASTAGGSAG
ncbi:coenzyme F420-0:L-glutamate ligase [Allobranchiibius sp. CTAmp26]|uniref:coenzyme F420-0:L-glutamate ligase n=1 Tax=Allobranchiibius sp. CTAmp26 TaxID=2815214 RepID=UPI001AA1BD68|nr:coenzyme F420-0:L-glutamate ligase [Allobranchiibius sp. CTAmp26]MBO1755610.1 coenzyme F420-0:L-glutamate ligase [Allobranchiibius sp. CTAmp26]